MEEGQREREREGGGGGGGREREREREEGRRVGEGESVDLWGRRQIKKKQKTLQADNKYIST